MAESYAQHADAIQKFDKWRHSAEVPTPGLGGPDLNPVSFIPRQKLYEHLKDYRYLDNLLDAVLQTDNDRAAVSADYVREHYLRTFATLLCIHKGHWIYHFQQFRSLRDEKLPYHTQPDDFPDDDHMFKNFKNAQWQFCAMTLQYDMKDRFREQEVLPIIHKGQIGEGGSATVHKIVVDDSHNLLRPPAQSFTQRSRHLHKNVFVLKTFRGKMAEENHKTERNAYAKLRLAGSSSPSIVAFYGSFIQGNSYNLIFEYADRGSLESFMERTIKPESPEDTLLFWDRLTNITHGLQWIHGKGGDDVSASQFLHGWHQDIKPANILVFSNDENSSYNCEFKIADLGLAHFKASGSELNEPSDLDANGTRAYGAPETYRSHLDSQTVPLQVKPDVDMWSIGCVLSEASVWARYGWKRVKEYRRQRCCEIEDESEGKTKGEQIFHWEGKLLDTVKKVHKEILGEKTVSHWITRILVERIIDQLLQHGTRPGAKLVFEQTRRLIEQRAEHMEISLVKLRGCTIYELTNPNNVEHETRSPPQAPPELTLSSLALSTDTQTYNKGSVRRQSVASIPDTLPSPSLNSQLPSHRDISGKRISQGVESSSAGATKTALTDKQRSHAAPDSSPTAPDAERPTLSVDEGHKWKQSKKLGGNPSLPGSEMLTPLNTRDHVFLIDNSKTMKEYTIEIGSVVSLLAYMLKGSDDDGLDICFTGSKHKINSKKSTKISSSINQQEFVGFLDMRESLRNILQDHVNNFGRLIPSSRSFLWGQSQPKQPRPLSLYVLTDAKWMPTDVGGLIRGLVQSMKDKGCPKEYIAIQFIRFGNDQASIDKLNELDHGLGLKAVGMDIVDHTFWNGNVLKMLLGAVNDFYDDDPI